MRRHSIIFALILGVFATFPLNSTGQDKVVDQIVAVVGRNIILKSDIENQFLQMQAQGITTEGDMKCEVLEQFLEQKLLLAEAELDTNITVADNQINQEMDSRMQYFIEHMGSEKEVEKYFNKSIVQVKADMSEAIRQQLMTQQKQQAIIAGVTITPTEVRRHYRSLPNDEIPVVNQQIEYEQITTMPKISDAEELRVKTRLRELKKRVENGDNFATLAVLYSQGPSSKNGGELGYMGRAQLDPAYASVAFNLKPGKVSKVVKSDFGYHIIQLIDRKGEKINTRHIIIKTKVEEEELTKARNSIDSIATYIKNDKITWEQAVYLYSSDKKTRKNNGLAINSLTGSPKFELDQLDPDVSKILVGLKIGEMSEPFLSTVDINNDQKVLKVIRLKSNAEQHKANMESDYQILSELVLAKKKEEVFRSWISKQQAETYIRIDDSYVNCNFKLKNWIK
jgi:peptidyl-prolyl cis-trans isomerase SurA